MAQKIKGPLFILFEGIDGSGKTTQADMLFSWLNKQSVSATRLAEPTGGRWGRKIRAMLSGNSAPDPWEQVRLFILDRDDDVANNLAPALSRGDVVVMDRYYYSNAAYQGAGGADPAAIIAENRARRFPEPDRIYFIDIDPGLAMERIGRRASEKARELFEQKGFLERVRTIFLSQLGPNALVVDRSGSPDEVFARIVQDMTAGFRR
jgi:dTMP kinase